MKEFLKFIVFGGIFAIPFITLIVVNDLFFPYITGKNFTFRILVTIITCAWLLLALLDTTYRPRWSWILGGFSALLGVMFVANLNGIHPPTSFWSNYERMEGYVTLVHLFFYFLVAGSMLRTKESWNWFWYISIAVASLIALDGVGHYLEGTGRVASFLGNAAYMAIYMLFHIFLSMYLFLHTKNYWIRGLYATLIVIFSYVLLQTGTRGTFIGLVVGSGITTLYIAIFASKFPQFRNYTIGAIAIFGFLVGGFLMVKDTNFVQENSAMRRVANIDLQQDLEVRQKMWNIAWQGVKERPILGWGQSNFNFIFNKHYDPFLYDQEQWFDRVHNIFLDWLVAGGYMGLLAYLILFVSAMFYIVKFRADDKNTRGFNVLEQGVLLGLMAGYFTHNLVVFDNIVSYIFFASVIAMIHSRVTQDSPSIFDVKIPKTIITQTIAPVMIVVCVSVIYYVNIPPFLASTEVLQALRSSDLYEQKERFVTAFNRRSSMGKQEIAEQMAQQAMRIASQSNLPESARADYVLQAEQMLRQLVEHKPGDARIHVFLGSFYRNLGDIQEASRQFALARELSPLKPSIILQQGVTELRHDNIEGAKNFFAEAYYLDQRNTQARVFYTASTFMLGEIEQGRNLFSSGDDSFVRQFAMDNFAIEAVNQQEDYKTLSKVYETRVQIEDGEPQNWANWAFTYYKMGEINKAIEILEELTQEIPNFARVANCFIDNIKAGREPEEGC